MADRFPVDVKYTLGGGAAGGFVSWLYSETLGTKLALPMLAAIAACIVLGATAALISVYVIANTDVSNIRRLLAFAVICGISWKPIIDSSVTYVNQKRTAGEADEASNRAVESLGAATSAQPGAVAAATKATTDLLTTSDQLKDPELERKAVARTEELIKTLSTKGDDPAAAVALTEIKIAARETGNEHLATLATTELGKFNSRRLEAGRFTPPNETSTFETTGTMATTGT